MVHHRLLRTTALALVLGATAAGCDSLTTAPMADGPSRVLLSSTGLEASLSTALLSQEPGRGKGGSNGPIDLSSIESINVQITSLSLLVSGAATDSATFDDDDDGDERWVELAIDSSLPDYIDLKNLGTLELATTETAVSGEIEAIRLTFGDSYVVFNDGTEEALFIPSGKVLIPAAGLTINQGSDLVITFATGTSVKKIVRTGRGLLMPPVFRADNGDDWDDDDFDSDDESDDESDDADGDDDPAGDDTAGDDTAGDDTAGDDTAGDDTAGDDTAGGDSGDDEPTA